MHNVNKPKPVSHTHLLGMLLRHLMQSHFGTRHRQSQLVKDKDSRRQAIVKEEIQQQKLISTHKRFGRIVPVIEYNK